MRIATNGQNQVQNNSEIIRDGYRLSASISVTMKYHDHKIPDDQIANKLTWIIRQYPWKSKFPTHLFQGPTKCGGTDLYLRGVLDLPTKLERGKLRAFEKWIDFVSLQLYQSGIENLTGVRWSVCFCKAAQYENAR